MYKKVRLFKRGYLINDNKNEAENEKLITYDKTRPRSRHGHKYTIYKMCLSLMIAICIKQHLSNI